MLGKENDITSRLPPEPFLYHAPNSDETVRFYGYGIALPRKDVIHAILTANRDVAAHGSSDAPLTHRMFRYEAADVFIVLHQSGRMTWKVWETALQGIAEFVEKYEYVELDFDIGQKTEGRFFGTGVLSMRKGQGSS